MMLVVNQVEKKGEERKGKERKGKERTTPFGVNLMRGQVLYRAAQEPIRCNSRGHGCQCACEQTD